MPHDWIIEVLDDLRTYARENRLDALAAEISELRLVALTEIASAEARARAGAEPAAASPLRAPVCVRAPSGADRP